MGSNKGIDIKELRSKFAIIQADFKKVIDGISDQKYQTSFELLIEITKNIVNNLEQLGLAQENTVYEGFDRAGVWRALNQCWLFALEHASADDAGKALLSPGYIDKLQECVIGWSESLACYGLVDYEMGFWEADIIEALESIRKSRFC